MTTKSDKEVWVLRLGWINPPPWNTRQGYIAFLEHLEDVYKKLRVSLQKINGSSLADMRNINVKHGENRSSFVTFDAGDRKWDFHLYRDVVGATRLKTFQPAKAATRRR